MTIADVLLLDFDIEAVNTKSVLERIPDDKGDWKPHNKSMTLGKLSMHVATLTRFGNAILTTDLLDIANWTFPPLIFEGREKLIEVAAGEAATVRTALAGISDEALQRDWTLRFGEHHIATAPRMLLYRTMFFNHLIHHRGQLNVYLRLLDVPVPGIYGPSADEPFPPVT